MTSSNRFWRMLSNFRKTNKLQSLLVARRQKLSLELLEDRVNPAAPVIESLVPVDDATNVSLSTTLQIEFDQDVQVGTGAGNINVYNAADGSLIEQVDVATGTVAFSAQDFSTDLVTVTLSSNLPESTNIYVEIDPTAIVNTVSAPGTPATLLSEDFEDRVLIPSPNRTGTADEGNQDTDFSIVVPGGWENNLVSTPGPFIEYRPWSFLDKTWWINESGNQARDTFALGEGTVAVADGDQYTDIGGAGTPIDAFFTSPVIDTTGIDPATVELTFDSSFRPYAAQEGSLTVAVNGGTPVVLDSWTTAAIGGNSSLARANETLTYDVDAAVGGITPGDDLVFAWRYFNAGNDWWWAIDNIAVTANISNEPFAGIQGDGSWDFQTINSGPPTLVSTSPADTSLDVPPGADITLVLSEDVALQGTPGNITITDLNDGSDNRSVAGNDPQVMISGNTITIDLTADLETGTQYSVAIGNDVFQDVAVSPLPFAGTTFTFATTDFREFPMFLFTPENGATGVVGTADLSITFGAPVTAVNGGTIELIQDPNGTPSTIETITLPDARVIVASNVVTINPNTDLTGGVEYGVQISAGAFTSPNTTLFFEDFEGLTLLPSPNRPGTADEGNQDTDYTTTPPAGWTRDLTTTPVAPTAPFIEYEPWAFLDKTWWLNEAGQARDNFTLGQGTVAVADGDQYADLGGVGGNSINTFLITPVIDLAGIDNTTLELRFDSSFRPEADQKGIVEVTFDGGTTWSEIFRRQGEDERNEAVVIDVDADQDVIDNGGVGATAQYRFRYFDADNNWWWAIDNIKFTADLASGVESSPAITAADWSFTTDGVPPTLVSSVPADDTINISIASPISLTFSEDILAGTGDITLVDVTAGTDTRTIPVGDAQVSIVGDTLTITPSTALAMNNEYAVQVAATAVTDLTGNTYAGITDNTTLNFITESVVPPAIESVTPVNGATDVGLSTTLEIEFDQDVKVGLGSGNIVLYRTTDNSVIESINVGSAQVTISGKDFTSDLVTVTLSSLLPGSTEIFIRIDPTAIVGTAASVLPVNAKLLNEDFEILNLLPSPNRTSTADEGNEDTDYTTTPPNGWMRDLTTTPVAPAAPFIEYEPWAFLDKTWWINEAGQARDNFTLGQGTVAVADGDQYADLGGVGGDSINTFLISPELDLTGIDTSSLELMFDSSFRPEPAQKGTVEVTFDGGTTWSEIFRREGEDERNEAVVIDVDADQDVIDAGGVGDTARFRWQYFDADNNWWWAIDNIMVTANIPNQPFGGINDNATYSFTTQPAVNLVSLTPADDSVDVVTNTTLVAEFDSFVQPATGNITVFDKTNGGPAIATIDVNSADVTFAGKRVIIDLSNQATPFPLLTGVEYYINIDPGAIVESGTTSLVSESFDGITLIDSPLAIGTADYNTFAGAQGQSQLTGWDWDPTTTPAPTGGPGSGEEYYGWTFLDPAWWDAQAGQSRNTFTKGTGVIAVADGDQYDDFVNVDSDQMNVFLSTPAVTLDSVNSSSLTLNFDSSFRPFPTQQGIVEVSFDGGTTFDTLLVLDDNTVPGGTSSLSRANESISLGVEGAIDPIDGSIIDVPDTGTAQFRFGYINAGNDWWWAIDNVEVLVTNGTPTGSAFPGITNQDDWTFTTDNTDPTVVTLTPSDGTLIDPSGTLSIEFNEPVQAGAGNVEIRRLSDNVAVETIAIGSASFDGNTVTFDPTDTNLVSGTDIYIFIPAGAIEDLSGNDFAGLGTTDPEDWDLTVVDITGPQVVPPFDPADDFVGAETNTNLTVTFDEPILKGMGNITIFNASDDSVVEVIDVNSAQVTIVGGNQLVIDPTNDLALNTGFYIQIDPGAVFDAAGGVANPTLFFEDFESLAPILLDSSNGSDGDNETDYISLAGAQGAGQLTGWTMDDRATPVSPTPEWQGWTFHDISFTINHDNQDRDDFLPELQPNNTIAIADPDEHDDQINNDPNQFSAILTSPSISLAGTVDNSVTVQFDSSWRPEDLQEGRFSIEFFDSGATSLGETIIFTWDSQNPAMSTDPNAIFKGFATNEEINILLDDTILPATADSMILKWDMVEAGNDWWWAIDNIKVFAGNPFAGITDETTWNFTTEAAVAPVIVTVDPADETTDVVLDPVLTVTFDEPIAIGTGNITLDNLGGGTDIVIPVTDAGQVSVSGNDLVIDPTASLDPGARYAVLLDANTVTDLASTPNNFAGLSDPDFWNFTTDGLDFIPESLLPADNTYGVGTTLQIQFEENVIPQAGAFVFSIIELDDAGAPTGTQIDIDVTANMVGDDPDGTLTLSGSDVPGGLTADIVTVNTTVDLAFGTAYAINITQGAFIGDPSGLPFPGITDLTTWNFFTRGPVMLDGQTPFTPADGEVEVQGDTTLVISFDEAVMAGTGTIIVTEDPSGTPAVFEQFDIPAEIGTNPGQAEISPDGKTVILRFTNNLIGAQDYSVQISDGALTSMFTTLLFEDFEGLTLVPFVSPTEGGGDGTDWTDELPVGWVRDNTTTPAGNPVEFFGWHILDKNSWNATAGQGRDAFTLATGAVAVADGDEYDDGTNIDGTPMDTLLITAPVAINNIDPATLTLDFLSSFNRDTPQKALVEISFDGTFTDVTTPLFSIDSTNDADFPGGPTARINEPVSINVESIIGTNMIPTTDGSTAQFRFRYFDANNDWWWAIDDVKIKGKLAAGTIDYPGFQDNTTWNFTADATAPVLVETVPVDDGTGAFDRNIILTFDDNMQAQPTPGNITLLDVTGTPTVVQQFAANDPRIVYSDNQVAIDLEANPPITLTIGNRYEVRIEATALENTAGLDFVGLPIAGNPPQDLIFTAVSDVDGPMIDSLTPDNDSTENDLDTDLVITFNENVKIGPGTGNIVVRDAATNEALEVINVRDAAVTFSGSNVPGGLTSDIVTIDLTNDLLPSIEVYVEIDPSTFTDTATDNITPGATLLSEDFENELLNPFVETIVNDGNTRQVGVRPNPASPSNNGFEKVYPAGWTADNSGVPGLGDPTNDGVWDYAGWTIMNKNSWIAQAGNQSRTSYTLGTGNVAVADPDQWDDAGNPLLPPQYNTLFETPRIWLEDTVNNTAVDGDSLNLTFDSSFRPYDTQTAVVDVTFDGSTYYQIFELQRGTIGNEFANINETVSIDLATALPGLSLPDTGFVQFRFGMLYGGNDWWWAIDNVEVTGDVVANPIDGILDDTSWDFTTADQAPPVLASLDPVDNATGVGIKTDPGQANVDLVLTFNENVQVDTGNITITEVDANGTPVGSGQVVVIDVANPAATGTAITVVDNVVTIDLADNLLKRDTFYSVTAEANTFSDTATVPNNWDGSFAPVSDGLYTFLTVDDTAPVLTGLAPSNNGFDVDVSTNIVITFDQDIEVQTPAGLIDIIDITGSGADNRQFAISDSQVSIAGNTLTIDLSSDLNDNNQYEVQIANTAIQDQSGNAFAGIGATEYRFTTGTVVLTPADDFLGVETEANLSVEFSRNVALGTSGFIRIRRVSDGSIIEEYDVTTNPAQVSISGGAVTINPDLNLPSLTQVWVEIEDGAVVDASDATQFAGGFANDDRWNFTTRGVPNVDTLFPADGSVNIDDQTNLVISFAEGVIPTIGTGFVRIFDAATDMEVQAIDITSPNVTVNGNEITIDPPVDLLNGVDYYINVDQGVFTFSAVNLFVEDFDRGYNDNGPSPVNAAQLRLFPFIIEGAANGDGTDFTQQAPRGWVNDRSDTPSVISTTPIPAGTDLTTVGLTPNPGWTFADGTLNAPITGTINELLPLLGVGFGTPEGFTPAGLQGGFPPEFSGWTFIDYNAWVSAAGDQARTQATNLSGTVAVADPDEYDDATPGVSNVTPVSVNVTTTTPGGGGADEVQTVAASPAAISGTFNLAFQGVNTINLAFDAAAGAVQAALEALPGIGAGNVSVAGTDINTGYTITFTGALANTDVAQLTADDGNLDATNSDFDAFLTTAPIDLTNIEPGSLVFEFDSSFRPEVNQTGRVEVSFDGFQTSTLLLELSTATSGGPNSTSRVNEALSFDLDNEAGDQQVQFRFSLTNAGNNWWWAVDNLALRGDLTPPETVSFDGITDTTTWNFSTDADNTVDAVDDTATTDEDTATTINVKANDNDPNGNIANARIIAINGTSFVDPTGLGAYLNFDDDFATTGMYADQTGNNNFATVGPGAQTPEQVASVGTNFGDAVFFNLDESLAVPDTLPITSTSNEFLQLNNLAAGNLDFNDSFTIVFIQLSPRDQIFGDNDDFNSSPSVIGNKVYDVDTGDTAGFAISDNLDGGLTIGANIGDGVHEANTAVPARFGGFLDTFANFVPYLSAVVVDRSTGEMTAYNAALGANAFNRGGGAANAFATRLLGANNEVGSFGNANAGPVTIGNDGTSGNPALEPFPRNFVGLIDDVSFWNRALSVPELESILQNASAGSPLGFALGTTFTDKGAKVTLNADGTIDYDPNGAFDFLQVGESTTDTFTYTIADQEGSETATVTVTITGVNDGPAVSVFGPDVQQVAVGDTATNFGVVEDPDGAVLTVDDDDAGTTTTTSPLFTGTIDAITLQDTVDEGFGSFPSTRLRLLDEDANQFNFLTGVSTNEVLYRFPIVSAGTLVNGDGTGDGTAAGGDTLVVTYTVDWEAITGDNDFGFVLSDGERIIGGMQGDQPTFWFMDGFDNGSNYDDDFTPSRALTRDVPVTVQITLTSTTVSMVVTNDAGDRLTLGTADFDDFIGFNLENQIDFLLVGDGSTEQYGFRSADITTAVPNGLQTNPAMDADFLFWNTSTTVVPTPDPLTVTMTGDDTVDQATAAFVIDPIQAPVAVDDPNAVVETTQTVTINIIPDNDSDPDGAIGDLSVLTINGTFVGSLDQAGLEAYLPFNDVSGNNIVDAEDLADQIGGDNNGAAIGSTPLPVFGAGQTGFGQSLYFNRVADTSPFNAGDTVILPGLPPAGTRDEAVALPTTGLNFGATNSFSVVFWTNISRFQSDGAPGVFAPVVTNVSDLFFGGKGWDIAFGGDGDNILGILDDDNDGFPDAQVPSSTGQDVAFDQWQLSALVIDRANPTTGGKLYVGLGSGNLLELTTDITGIGDLSGGSVVIGDDGTGAFNFQDFVGQVDDLSIWNRALASSEINTIFRGGQAGTPLSGLGQIQLPSGALVTVNGDGSIDYDTNGAFNLSPGQTATDTFTYTIQDADGLESNPATVTVTIQGPPLHSIAATDATKAEGNSGTTDFTFTVTRTGYIGGTSSVDYAVTGSGSDPADVTDFGGAFPSGTVSFAAGEDSKTITIAVSGDTDIEPDEGFTVTISNATSDPSGGAIDTATAVGVIVNDDATVSIAATDADKAEGDTGTTDFTFTVTRTGDVSGAASVDYAVTGSGSDPADAADFGGTLPSGTVNFAAGEDTATITIGVSGDNDVEANEGFTVTLSNPSAGVSLGTATAIGVIQNDDAAFAVLDFNQDGIVDPSTDGNLMLAVLFDLATDTNQDFLTRFRGNTTLTNLEIYNNVKTARENLLLDVNGDGTVDASTDGNLILAVLFEVATETNQDFLTRFRGTTTLTNREIYDNIIDLTMP